MFRENSLLLLKRMYKILSDIIVSPVKELALVVLNWKTIKDLNKLRIILLDAINIFNISDNTLFTISIQIYSRINKYNLKII